MTPQPDAVLRVALEAHFVEVDGHVYTCVEFAYPYWSEFLDVFECVRPIARISRIDRVPDGWVRADGPGVIFHKVYDYRGFWQFLRYALRTYRDCRAAIRYDGPILLRTGLISNLCRLGMKGNRQPYAIELLGHAGDSVGMVRNVRFFGLNRALANISHWIARRLVRGAVCANYVSRMLRSLYPTANPDREWIVSDVRLPPEAYAAPRSAEAFNHGPIRLLSVGRLEPEKGHAFLLHTVARLVSQGFDVACAIAGGGREMDALRELAQNLGVAERVTLHGQVPAGEPLMKLLSAADLFILPSLTEGLPRALVEAMALGLPCIGSRAGGIVELLQPDALVTPGNSDALADAIARVTSNPGTLAEMSARNVETASEYRLETLRERRREFWRAIRSQWLDFASNASSRARLSLHSD